MPSAPYNRYSTSRPAVLGTLIGGICLLLIGMSLHAVIAHDRTEEAMHRLMVGKGGALLSSLESSLRSSRRNNIMPRQDFLLEAVAGIDGLLFAAITGPDGFVLAHSNLDRLGEAIRFGGKDMTPLDMERLAPNREAQWMLTTMEGGEAFVLYKRIGQALIYSSSGKNRGTSGMSAGYDIPLTLFIGLDPAPLFLARAEDQQRTRLIAVGATFSFCLRLSPYTGRSGHVCPGKDKKRPKP